MKISTAVLCPEPPVTSVPSVSPVVLGRSRLADYVALTKPRIAVLVLFTVAIGCYLAVGPAVNLVLLLHAVVGTALVAGGARAPQQLPGRHTAAPLKPAE